jgi:hypothetical protein
MLAGRCDGAVTSPSYAPVSASLGRRAFRWPPCSRPEAHSSVKSEIAKTEAGDREEESLVREKVEGTA